MPRGSFIETSGVIFGLSIDHSYFTSVTLNCPSYPPIYLTGGDVEHSLNFRFFFFFRFKAVICTRFAKIMKAASENNIYLHSPRISA